MAKNDMEVIMYKILRYLYDCSKEGKRPCEEDFGYSSRLLGDVPKAYWELVIEELVSHGLVKGVYIGPQTKDERAINASEAKITFDGVQFLEENSRMQEARNFAGKAFETVLASIIAALA